MIGFTALVSTGLTIMASTPWPIKFCTCWETSPFASSICDLTPSFFISFCIEVRRIVRKLSSNSAIETPMETSFAITTAGSMQANKEATIVFLIFIVDP